MSRNESGAVASGSLARRPEQGGRSGHAVDEHRATQPAARLAGDSKPFIAVKNVWQQYGDQVVLERLDLSVAEGEFCTLVGASGCGKSTFLRLLLGQERPSRGEILLDGAPIAHEPDASRGVVFQRYSVFPHLTVLDNVALGLELPKSPLLGRLLGGAKRRAREEAAAMLEKVGLGHALKKYPAQLSGGMQQRLAIAQALIMKPRVLLLDEPFGALDPGIRKDMHGLLLELWNETRLTVFMVTHDLSEGFTLGTRLMVFDRPRIDPHAPGAYGARVTYDIPLNEERRAARAAEAVLPAQVVERLEGVQGS
ncbi:ABC transporter ATP-binding protein [Stutzerimonas balearica]|uniref:Lauroyl acyltransferase n=1 Tax=Stutzerimonas balearica DSM 6083 TaxID=1123016 RepID=A0A8D3XXL4_9GAMM|nr:ABC transporter ATP-binding protein [Stutzerimonas balearica]AJE13614.1 lauroyl acyltransferase [Stutzerimonas balearica DSM 6083]SDL92509.1 NitT/TauT family transport system ATP-binding protein [Stutzerimonas balearica DSM 6083]